MWDGLPWHSSHLTNIMESSFVPSIQGNRGIELFPIELSITIEQYGWGDCDVMLQELCVPQTDRPLLDQAIVIRADLKLGIRRALLYFQPLLVLSLLSRQHTIGTGIQHNDVSLLRHSSKTPSDLNS